jgi:predicted O-methyltransferase YrrM
MMDKIRYWLIGIRNIIIGGNIASLTLLRHPKEMARVISILLFYYRTITAKDRLEQKNPQVVLASPTQMFNLKINTDSYFWGTDPSYTKDILALSILATLSNAKLIFEIGTLDGYTALHFAMNSAPDAMIYSLDLPQHESIKLKLHATTVDTEHQTSHQLVSKYYFTGLEYQSKIQCLFGDSATFDYTRFHGKIDLFFIDGSHSYEYVKSDTENALLCVRKGGVIAWHDYGRLGVNGVSRWLHEFAKIGNKIYSVPGSSVAYMMVI